MQKKTPHILTEVFEVDPSSVPKLFAYNLDVRGKDTAKIGGKLSYRLKKNLKGNWAWCSFRILTDSPVPEDEIMKVVEGLWKEQPETFKALSRVYVDRNWRPSPQAQADFITRALFPKIDKEIRNALARDTQDLGSARVERAYEVRGWSVGDKPAISISVSSNILHKEDLKQYSQRLSDEKGLIGLWVSDKNSPTLKGEVVGIAGKLADHRTRLQAITSNEKTLEIINRAPDDEIVVTVRSRRNEYDYIASALRIIVKSEHHRRFKINSRKALSVMKIEPSNRYNLILNISKIAREAGLISNAYRSNKNPDRFLSPLDIDFKPFIRFGSGKTIPYNGKRLLYNLQDFGLYKQRDKFQNNEPIRIGVINALGSDPLDSFLNQMKSQLLQLGFASTIEREMKIKGASRADFEACIDVLQKGGSDVLIAFLPDVYDQDDEDEDFGSYHRFKSLTVGRGIPSQVVFRSTIKKSYAMANIILGILGKTGNTPFVLGEPLPYTDYVVGIDIAREQKKRLDGTLNVTAVMRVYCDNGELLHYTIHDAPLEGETIPAHVIEGLFPSNVFKDKKVVVHRDGYFRGDEKRALLDRARKIGAEFHLVEVIKTNAPRIYALDPPQIVQPPKGSAFKLSDTEAFLVSTLPPFKDATPQPLRLRAVAPFTIEKAIHSVLSLTLLHLGSLRPPRLPISIHFSDKIAYLAIRGIKPKDMEGNLPFWL